MKAKDELKRHLGDNNSQKKDGGEIILKKERQVLLIINDKEVCNKLEYSIHEKFGFEVEAAKKGKEALKRIEASPWQYDVAVIYVDLKAKDKGLEVLKKLKKNYLEIEVIFIINSDKRDTDEAWHGGAFNCFITPINPDGIAFAIKFAREHAQSRRERKMLEKLQELSIAINSATELHEIQNLACQAAVEILNVDHSGLVEFGKDLSTGKVIAEYPEGKFIDKVIKIKGIHAEEQLVYNKEIINVPDLAIYNKLGKVQKILMDLKIRSVLIVPVVLNGKVSASISLDMIKKKRVFYSDEIKLCEKLANQVAVAIGKARRLKELSVLNKIGNDISFAAPLDLDVKKILEMVKKHASALIDMSNFYISLYDEVKKEYSFPLFVDKKDHEYGPGEMKTGLTDYVRRRKKPVLVDKALNDKLIEEGEIKLVGTQAHIWLGAPMIVRNRVLGVMAVQSYENENAYDDHDLSVLGTIASQTAIAIDNAQLFKDARRRIRDLEIVNNIVQIMSTKLNTEDLLQSMVTQITEKLNCTHCTFFLFDKKHGKLVPQKTHGLESEKILTRTFKPGEGLAGWVFEHGESIIKSDAKKDDRYAQARRKKSLPRSMLVAPVKVSIRTIGVISAEQDEYDWFSESDRQLVDTLTRHAGIAIERALGLNLIQEIGLQLISSEEEEKILQRVVTGAIELTNTISGTLYLISDDGESVVKTYRYPTGLDHPPPRMHKKDGYTRQVIGKGKMFIIPDLSKDDRVNLELLKYISAMIAVPLKIGEKVVGVLFLHDKESRSFSETECSLLEILASQAAIGIYNARLYQESQRRLAELETLYYTSQDIASETMNIKSVLETILKKAVQFSNADSAQILFHDKAKNQLKCVFTFGTETLLGETLRRGEGINSKAFELGETICINDYHKDPDSLKRFEEPKYKVLFNSMAVVPLKWKDEKFGTISLTSRERNFFTQDDIHLLERFAGSAAIAIAIAREIYFRKKLLNNSPNAIIAIDPKGTVKEFNKASEQIFGYTKEEVLNKSVVNLWGGREEAKQAKRLLYESENGTVSNVETIVTSKAGEKIPVLFSGSIMYAEGYGEEKEEIGSIGQIEDQRIVSLKGRTRKLFETIDEINRVDALPELLNVILRRAIGLLEADSGYIMLPKGDYFEVLESFNFNEEQAVAINLKINKGKITHIIEKGIPKTISNSSLSNSELPKSKDGNSALFIPLKIENNIIGVIYLESHINGYFREENELLQILSSEAAIGINRAQLKEESERLELLKELGAQIRKKGKFSEYKNNIVEITQRILRSEMATVFLFQKSDRTLIRQAWYPNLVEQAKISEIYPEMVGITGKILACGENEHIIYNDEKEILDNAVPTHLEKHECLPSWKNRRNKFTGSAIQHLLAVPIVGEKGKVFGALRVVNKITKEYTAKNPVLDGQGFREPEDVELLKTIASLLSQALSSERKAEKLTLLREITEEISEKTDIKGICDCVVQSVVTKLGYSACSMSLVRGDKIELISHAGFSTDKIQNMTINISDGFLGSVVKGEKAKIAYDILSADIEKNSGYLCKDFAKEEDFRSVCCVPIKGLKEEVIGVIVVYMRKAPYEFTDYEINDNFFPIAATCAISLRKVEAVNHLQKLLEILEWMHILSTKSEIMEACIYEMLTIFDAHAAVIFDTEKAAEIEEVPLINLSFNHLYSINIHTKIKISKEILSNMERDKPQIFNADEFPGDWQELKDKYSQCLAFTIDFRKETLGIVVLFTGAGVHSILPELEILRLSSVISRQLAIAFKNLEFIDEIARVRTAEPAIISAQYVSGMIHELASSAHKGKGAITYIRGTPEYKKIKSQEWKIELSKTESAFDDIGKFTTQALEFKNIAQMKFEKTLEYRSINKAVQDVLHDINNEVRKKFAKVKWEFDKNHNQKHAYFDEILIKQAIRNLVSNSLRWIPEGGCITITSSQKEDYISILVEDNGWGIEPGTENRIFEPYFTTSPQGYGIGLFFVKNVVKLHKGSISLVSAKNPTTFEIKISSKLKK